MIMYNKNYVIKQAYFCYSAPLIIIIPPMRNKRPTGHISHRDDTRQARAGFIYFRNKSNVITNFLEKSMQKVFKKYNVCLIMAQWFELWNV